MVFISDKFLTDPFLCKQADHDGKFMAKLDFLLSLEVIVRIVIEVLADLSNNRFTQVVELRFYQLVWNKE